MHFDPGIGISPRVSLCSIYVTLREIFFKKSQVHRAAFTFLMLRKYLGILNQLQSGAHTPEPLRRRA